MLMDLYSIFYAYVLGERKGFQIIKVIHIPRQTLTSCDYMPIFLTLTEWKQYNESKDCSLVRGLLLYLHNATKQICTCQSSTMVKSHYQNFAAFQSLNVGFRMRGLMP